MNARTREELQNFAKQMQALSASLVIIIGMETAAQTCQAAQDLITALAKDETIPC